MPEPLFLGTAVLLILMGSLPHAHRLAEVNDIEFIFCLQAQWQPFGEKEERGRQAQEANCAHGIPQLSHVWVQGLVGFFKCCKICVCVCLFLFALTTLPSGPKVPCLMSSMGLT